MRAEAMFKEYGIMKKELTVLQFQMSQFKGVDENDIILSMQFSHPEGGDRVQTSNISDKTASVAMNYKKIAELENDEWFNYLWNRYRYISEEVAFFESSVAALPDILPNLIMDMLEKSETWDDLMYKYNIGRSTISKYKKRAIALLDEVYELRDRQTEAYILS